MSISRRCASVATVAALAALFIAGPASPALAHDALVGSDPESGAQLDTAPATIDLEFSSEIMEVGAEVLVLDAEGENWVSGEVAVEGTSAVATLTEGMPEAGYQVRWRVVSGDGHPISGLIPFAVGEAEPLASVDDVAGADAAEAPVETPDANATAAPDAEGGADAAQDEGISPWVFVGAGAGIVALLVGLFVTFSRRSRAAGKGGQA